MFRKSPTCTSGYRGKCKTCDGNREYARRYQKEHNIRRDNQGKRGRSRNMIDNAKRRAIDKDLDFNLDIDYLESIAPDICPVLNIPLDYYSSSGIQGRNPYGPSLDRFDNSKGYTKDNVRIISWRANSLKSDATIAEIEAILTYMKGE